MTVQTSYEDSIQIGLPGLIYDLRNTEIESFAAEGEVGMGRFVSRSATSPEDAVVAGGAASIGISVRTAKENLYQDQTAKTSYVDKETVGVLRNGKIWAEFDAAGGTIGDDVTITADGSVSASGGGTALTEVKAVIEKPASAIQFNNSTTFIGLVRIS